MDYDDPRTRDILDAIERENFWASLEEDQDPDEYHTDDDVERFEEPLEEN